MKKILLLAMVLLVGCSNQNNGCTQGENEQTKPKATPHNLHLQTKPPSKMLSG